MESRKSHSGDSKPGPSWSGSARISSSSHRPPMKGLQVEARAAGDTPFWEQEYDTEFGTLRAETEGEQTARELHLKEYFKTVEEGKNKEAAAAAGAAFVERKQQPEKILCPIDTSKKKIDIVIKQETKMVLISTTAAAAAVFGEEGSEDEEREEEQRRRKMEKEEVPRKRKKEPEREEVKKTKVKEKKNKENAPEIMENDEDKRVEIKKVIVEEEGKIIVEKERKEEDKKEEVVEEEEEKVAATPFRNNVPDGHKQPQHFAPPPPSGHVRLYKVALDQFITGKGKDRIFRYNGKCVGDKHKHLDFNPAPSDPRSKYRRTEPPKKLVVPKLLVDDQYTGIPPKREVTISNLSDNVNKDFLEKMVKSQKLDVDEVQVIYHPTTKKHLNMALVIFQKSTHARAFVEGNDGHNVMGIPMTCIFDPFAAHLNSMFVKLTGLPCIPALPYLQGMSEHQLSLRREEIVGKEEPPQPEPVEEAPVAATETTEPPVERSPSPMDTSNTPPEFDPHRPPPIVFPPMQPMAPMPPMFAPYGVAGYPPMQPMQQHTYVPDPAAAAAAAAAFAAASTSKPPSPPPPYSELPPVHHESTSVHDDKRSGRKRSRESEGSKQKSRDKRRRESTSSSSSYSEKEEDRSSSSRRRDDRGVERKREEYLRVKRYVSSERDPNGDKRIVKEVKTMTYKRRTEHRTTIGQNASPDSFDEEMKRRERSMSRGMRSAEKRGRDEMRSGWSSPSSDSDNAGGRRKKRGKEHSRSDRHRDRDRRAPPPPESTISSISTPSISSASSVATGGGRQRGFHDAPPAIFDPSQPPPPVVVVPPVGLVLPDCSKPPPPTLPLPMLLPPPALPGGFIPPPEMFGLQSTPAMLSAAASAAAAGMTPLPSGTPMMGYNCTPLYSSPPKAVKLNDGLGFSSLATSATSSPLPMTSSATTATASAAGLSRVGSSSSMTVNAAATSAAAAAPSIAAGGRTPVPSMATPPTTSEGGSTPAAAGTPVAEKKANIDDRLSQLFGLKKAKKEEEVKEMKHVASAPSISTLATEQPQQQQPQRKDESEDMEVEDDDMDVASSSSGDAPAVMMMMGRETEEERRRKEDNERRRKEDQADWLTHVTLDKLLSDLRQQIAKDMKVQLEKAAFGVVEEWQKKAKSAEVEKKMQLVRESLAAATASAAAAAPKRDPMEEMLAAKLLSPEGLNGGISKVFSGFQIIKRKNLEHVLSRDGTPVSRDVSRGPSMEKRRSASRSPTRSSRDSSESSTSSSSESEDEDEVRRPPKIRPNMRNIESSQESSAASTTASEMSESEDEEEVVKERRSAASRPEDDDEVDVVGMSEDEAEHIKKGVKDAEEGRARATFDDDAAGPSSAAAAFATASTAATLDNQVPEKSSSSTAVPVTAPAVSDDAATAAALQLQQEQQLAELMLHRPAMRVATGDYDPIRFDHPYVVQLGVPLHDGRSIPAAAARRIAQEGATAAAAAARADGKDGTIPPTCAAAQLAATSISTTQSIKKRMDGEKVPTELRQLQPQPVAVPRKPAITVDDQQPTVFRPRKTYKKRAEAEEKRILDSFKAGMDQEDEKYLKMSLAELQSDGKRPFGSDRTVEFESRLRAYTPRELVRPTKVGRLDNFYDDEDLAGIVPHSTGCARTEGFYRLTFKQKIRIMRRPEAFQDRTEINERDEVVTRHQVQAQKEQRSMNRRLQTMTDSSNSDFFKVNQLKYRKKMIKFARSRIHGWGLYALEPIAPDDMIVEYIGQKIRPIVADEREKAYERRGIGSSYLFRIDDDEVIDATKQGNFARFINHSCQPNCYAKVVTVDGDKRIVIYSKALIQKGDEITYDYKFPLEEDKIECLCGAPACRGTLN